MPTNDFQVQPSLSEEIRSGDTRRSLIAVRDYVVHELEGNRCARCAMSQLRTGDTASLVLRLQKLIEDIAALGPPQDHEAEKRSGVVNLASIRNRRDREPDPDDSARPQLGTKAAPRRQSGRRRNTR